MLRAGAEARHQAPTVDHEHRRRFDWKRANAFGTFNLDVTGPGQAVADSTPFGTGCGAAAGCFGSFYEDGFDLANSGYTIENTGSGYQLRSLQGSWIAPAGDSPALLAPGGRLLLEIGVGQAEATRAALARRGFVEVDTRRDLAGIERIVAGTWP